MTRVAVAVIGHNVVMDYGTPEAAQAALEQMERAASQPPSGDAPCPHSRHLDFCGGGEFCSLDDCMCECHIRPSGDALLSAAMLVNGGWHSVVEGDNVRMRYASDLPARLNTLREALAQPPSGDARCTHRDLAGNEAHVVGCPQLNAHGYTCGFCAWGRDHVATRGEYEAHKAATGHVGEPPSGDAPDLREALDRVMRSEPRYDHDVEEDEHGVSCCVEHAEEALAPSQPPSGDAPDLREAVREWAESKTALDAIEEAADAEFAATGTDYWDNTANFDRGEAISKRFHDAEDALLAAEALAASPPSSPATPAPLDVESPASGVSIVGPPSDGRWLVQWLVRLIDDGRVTDLNPDDEYVVAARAYANQEGGDCEHGIPRNECKLAEHDR